MISNTQIRKGRGEAKKNFSFLPGGSGSLPKDGDGCRIASKGVDVALDPVQSQPLVIKPDGERRISVDNLYTYIRQAFHLPYISLAKRDLWRVRKAKHVGSKAGSN